MTAVMTPEAALAYLSELSTDFREGLVLDSDGRSLAGDPALADHGRALLAGSEAAACKALAGGMKVCAAHSERHAIVVRAGPFAMPGLVLHDIRSALGHLE